MKAGVFIYPQNRADLERFVAYEATGDPSLSQGNPDRELWEEELRFGALVEPLGFDQMNLGVMNEQPLVQDARMADDRHVGLDLHVLVAADQRALDHVISHAVHTYAALLWHPVVAQVCVMLCKDFLTTRAGLQQG